MSDTFKKLSPKWLLIACLPAGLGAAMATSASAQGKYGQHAPPDAFTKDSSLAYYGSENSWDRRFFSEDQAVRFDKRRGQRQLLAIQEGRAHEAVQWCEAWLEDHPEDLETLFNLTVARCQLGEAEKAWLSCQRAVETGLPLARFVAGPRELLRPLTESQPFKEYLAQHPVRIVHGPLLGSMTDSSARFWVRTADATEVVVQVFKTAAAATPLTSAAAKTNADGDFTAVVEITGLSPNSSYYYDVIVQDVPYFGRERPALRTYPQRGSTARFRVAFGGGAGFTPRHERMWDTLAQQQLAAFLTLGDNVYIDLPEEPGPLHRYTYYRRQSRPEFQRLVRATPIYAIWDDHDVAIDDVWMGPFREKPPWKQPMLRLFKQNWNNPGYGNAAWPGCWFRFAIADVDFFLLDGRFYRENPFGDRPSMLGATQLRWLWEGLATSEATFKVVVSPVPWAPGAKPGSRDTWDGFAAERESIFSWLAENAIDGVILLSADRHRSDAWLIQRNQGYPLYEFSSSRLTNIHTHECLEDALICYNEKCSCGRLTFDTTRADPTVTYDIVNIDGEAVESLTVSRSQLRSR